ncbi:MAG: DUF2029 domain-containing protein [Candidatus Riflebacteria bacterium]|nr:DUF2029 domain-containing protein [Candidatus Riflebacteria bacterium]
MKSNPCDGSISSSEGSFWNSIKSLEGLFIICGMILFLVKVYQNRFPMTDFKVYYDAARHFLNSDNLYNPSLFYRFKYPPCSPAFFTPFLLLPFWLTKVPAFLTILISFALILRTLSYWTNQETRGWLGVVFLMAWAGLVQFEIHLGQVTFFELLLLLWMFEYIETEQNWKAGLLYAVSLHLKPFGWTIALWGAVRGKYRFLMHSAIFFVILCFVPMLFYGFSGTISLWQGFFTEMMDLEKQNLSLFALGNNSISSIFFRWTGLSGMLSESNAKYIGSLINLAVLIIPLMLLFKKDNSGNARLEGIWILAIIPVIGPSDQKYFFLTLPLAWVAINRFRELPRSAKILIVLGLTCIGFNIYDLWGKKISHWLTDISITGVGGFFIYLSGYYTSLKESEKKLSYAPGIVNLFNIREIRIFAIVIFLFLVPTIYFKAINRNSGFICLKCHEIMIQGNRHHGIKSLEGRPICKSCGSANIISLDEYEKMNDLSSKTVPAL